jgi:hypothetical protein
MSVVYVVGVVCCRCCVLSVLCPTPPNIFPDIPNIYPQHSPPTMTAYPRSISSVPYTDAPNQLQTLDVWLPRPLEQSDPAHSIWIMQVPALSPLQRPLLTTPQLRPRRRLARPHAELNRH